MIMDKYILREVFIKGSSKVEGCCIIMIRKRRLKDFGYMEDIKDLL